jgi:hypothetical protein
MVDELAVDAEGTAYRVRPFGRRSDTPSACVAARQPLAA